MTMRLTYVPEMQAEIQRIAEEAVTAGVMTEINDNAFLKVEENRVAMIFNDWNDQRAGADIISYMNGYKDPRREKMFTTVKMIVYDENFQPQEVDGYAGIRIGIDVTTKDEMGKCIQHTDYQQYQSFFMDECRRNHFLTCRRCLAKAGIWVGKLKIYIIWR